MALSVLIYHYSGWSDISYAYPLNDLVNRLGIYAVATFYILSGATLALVYIKKEVNKEFLKDFSIKRILRIAPLLYIATTLTFLIILAVALKNHDLSGLPNLWEILMNYTLLFGWLDHNSYIATGAWSIGNELVFYSIFPIMLWLIKKSTTHYIVFFILTVLATLYFSFFLFDNQETLGNQWTLYINPINQIYLFAGGFLIGWLYKVKQIKVKQKSIVSLLIVSILVFVFLPISGEDQINYLTGYAKIVLSLSVFTMCFSVMFIKQTKSSIATGTLKYFGDISYSIYLLHPVSFTICQMAFGLIGMDNKLLTIFASIIATFIMATISYRFVEKPLVGLGKKVTTKKKQNTFEKQMSG